jgi:hypothetical protein
MKKCSIQLENQRGVEKTETSLFQSLILSDFKRLRKKTQMNADKSKPMKHRVH